MPTPTSSIKRALNALLDRLPSRRQAQHREQLGPVPDFLMKGSENHTDPVSNATPAERPIGIRMGDGGHVYLFPDGHTLRIRGHKKDR
jgi:hypothetical protein